MDINYAAFLSFVFITSFTPGPNNNACASLGVLRGFRGTLPFIAGIVSGFFGVMLLVGWFSGALLARFESFEIYLRIFGAVYILWLAYHTLRASYNFDESQQKPLGFTNGMLLQFLNPKAIVYSLTLFTTFLAPVSSRPLLLMAAALFLCFVAFLSITTWTLFGAAIRSSLYRDGFRRAVNIVLALLMVYTALEIAGLF